MILSDKYKTVTLLFSRAGSRKSDPWHIYCTRWRDGKPGRKFTPKICPITRAEAGVLCRISGFTECPPTDMASWGMLNKNDFMGIGDRLMVLQHDGQGHYSLWWKYKSFPPPTDLDLRKALQVSTEQDWRPEDSLPEDYYSG